MCICLNQLKIKGNEENINRVNELILKDYDVDFNKLNSFKKDNLLNENKFMNVSIGIYSYGDYSLLSLLCDTVNEPNKEILDAIVEALKDIDVNIEYYYYEGEQCIAGELKYYKGELLKSSHFSKKEDDIKYWSYIIEEEFEDKEWFETFFRDYYNMIEEESKAEIEIDKFNNLIENYNIEEASIMFSKLLNEFIKEIKS